MPSRIASVTPLCYIAADSRRNGDPVSDRSVTRRLAAILVADAVGYSRLMEIDELATHRQFKADLSGLIVPKISEFRGRVVKTTGDGLMAEFGSVVDAVQCAADVQRRLAERNADLPDERRFAYRMGINLGDIIIEDNDIYGDDVNTAVRLEGLADPGGINVSGNVVRYARGKMDVDFEDLGDHRIKNVTDPIRVYRVQLSPEGAVTARARPPSASAPMAIVTDSIGLQATAAFNRPAIAVLPFENLNNDPAQDYFCDGLTNDITTDLSKFADLMVIAPHSAFVYKGRRAKLDNIARDLGVQYVLEGSIQRSGDKVRVNAQLIAARAGHQVWAERFDRALTDLFALQDELIELIVTALAVKVSVVEHERASRKRPDSMTAYEAFLKGRYSFATESQAALRQSLKYLELACEVDPHYARAWAFRSYYCMLDWWYGWSGPAALEEAQELALRASQLDPNDYMAQFCLGFYHLRTGQFDAAARELQTALAMNRHDPDLLVDVAEGFVYLGRHAEAIELMKQALTRNPHGPDWYRWNLGWAYYFAQDYEKSIEELGRIRKLDPHVELLLAADYARLDRGDHAARWMRSFLGRLPDWTLTKESDSSYFKNDIDRNHWMEGVRLAGLPDTAA